MKRSYLGAAMAWTAIIGTVLPIPAFANDGTAQPLPAVGVRDVALSPAGVLTGYLADARGNSVPHALVHISHNHTLVETVQTDENGRFLSSMMRGGVYYLAYDSNHCVVRAWGGGTAPPHAPNALVLVTQPIVRGQGLETIDPKKVKVGVLTALGLSTGALITAIVLPLVLDDDDADVDI